MRCFLRAWLACFAVLLTAACAELPRQSASEPVLGPPLPRFTAEGRISLRQGDRRDHLRFSWEHAPGRDAVLLMSPLGQGLAALATRLGPVWDDTVVVVMSEFGRTVRQNGNGRFLRPVAGGASPPGPPESIWANVKGNFS